LKWDYRTWKQTGVNPVTFSNRDTAHDYIGFVMKLLISGLFIPILVYSISDKFYTYLLPAWYLENNWMKIAGIILIHASLLWILMAQAQMSSSWRIGLDETNKTKLITHGIFSVSRNPVFLGMMLTVFGIFLIIPNAVTLVISLGTYFILQIQVRLEESFLAGQHGELYIRYKVKTKRFI
jgi:protein-S-isoprenylcysteine O-methyltransferase Ste14